MNQQHQQKPGKSKEVKMTLRPKEVSLIIALLTKFTHGEVVISMRDGVPQHIKQAWRNDALVADGLSTPEGTDT